MKYIFTVSLTLFLFNFRTNGQELANKWLNTVRQVDGFQEIDKSKFDNWDFGTILSNQPQNNPLST